MFENILSTILNTTVGTFLKDVSPDQLKISLGGRLRLENVEIKPEAFDFLKLPVAIRHGRVGVLEIQLSWTGLTSKPVQVTLSDVYIVVGVAEDETVDAAELNAKILKQRLDALNNWELLRFPEKEVQTESKGALMKIVDTIVDHVTVTVANVHVMLEGEGINVGVGIGSAKVYPTDAAGNQVFKCINTTELSRRKIEVCDVCVYVNVDPARATAATETFMKRRTVALKGDSAALSAYDRIKRIKAESNADAPPALINQRELSTAKTTVMSAHPLVRSDSEPYNTYCRSLFTDIHNPRWCHIISPFSVSVDFIMRKPPAHVLQQRSPMEATMEASVRVGVITIGVQQHQYQALLRILSMISQNPAAVDLMRKQSEEDVGVMELDYVVSKLLKELREEHRQSLKAAGTVVQEDGDILSDELTAEDVGAIYERLSPLQQEQVLSGMRYAELYKRNLLAYTPPLPADETAMRDIEKQHPLLRVLSWREAAVRIAAYEYQTDAVTWRPKPSTSFFTSLFGSRAPPAPTKHIRDLQLKELIMFPGRHAEMERRRRAAEDGMSPHYPNMAVHVDLEGCEAALLEPNRARKVSLGVYGLRAEVQLRNASQGISVAISRLQAEDCSNPNTLYPLFMHSSAVGGKPFLHADVSIGDSSVRPELGYDMAIVGVVQPVYITIVPKLLLSLVDFFAPPADLSIGTEAVKELTSRYADMKQGLQTSVVASLANRSRMFIDLDIAAPTIVIPAVVEKARAFEQSSTSAVAALRSRQASRKSFGGVDEQRSHAMCICVGRITVSVTPPSLASVTKNKELLEASKADPTLVSGLSLSAKLERLYDYYNVRLHDVSIFCVDSEKIGSPAAGDYLLKPFALAVSAGLSLINDSVATPAERINAPGMAIDVDMGAIDLVVSPVLLARVLRVGKGIVNALHEATTAKNAVVSASTASSSSTDIVLEDDKARGDTRFSETLESLVDAHADKLVKALSVGSEAPKDVVETVPEENVHAVQIAVFVKLSRVSVNLVNDHIPLYPIPVLSIAAESIHVTLAVRAKDMSVCTVMGGVFITDDLTESQFSSASARKYFMQSQLEPVRLPTPSLLLGPHGVDTNAFAAEAMHLLLSVGYNAQAARDVPVTSSRPFLPTAALDMPRAVPLSAVSTAFMTVTCMLPQRSSPLYAFADTVVTVAVAPLALTVNREALPPLLLFALKQMLPPCPTCEDTLYGPADMDFSPPQLWATPTVDLRRDLHNPAVDALITKIITPDAGAAESVATTDNGYSVSSLLAALTHVSDDDLDKCYYGLVPSALPAFPCPAADALRDEITAWANAETPAESTRVALGQRVAEFIITERARISTLASKLDADSTSSEELLELHRRANAHTMLKLERLVAHLNYLEMHSAHFEQRIATRAAIEALRQKLALRRRALLIVREKERNNAFLSRRWRAADLGAQLGGVCVVDGDAGLAAQTLETICETELHALVDTADPAKLSQRRLMDIFNFDDRFLRVTPPLLPATLVPTDMTRLVRGDLTATGPQVMPLTMDARVHMGGVAIHLASQELSVLTFSLESLTLGAALSAFSTNAKVALSSVELFTEASPVARKYTDMVLALDAEFAQVRVSNVRNTRPSVHTLSSSAGGVSSLLGGALVMHAGSPELLLDTVVEEDETISDASFTQPSRTRTAAPSPTAAGTRSLGVEASARELELYLDEHCGAAEAPYMPASVMAAYARQMHRRAQHHVPHRDILYTVAGQDLLTACVCLRAGETMVRDDTDEFEYFSTACVDRMLGMPSAAHTFTLTQTAPSGRSCADITLAPPTFNTPVLVRGGRPVAPIAATLCVGGLRVVLCYVVVDLLQKYVAGLDQVMVVIAQSYAEKRATAAPAPATKADVSPPFAHQSPTLASPISVVQPTLATPATEASLSAAPFLHRTGTVFHDAAVSPVPLATGVDVPLVADYSPPMGSAAESAVASMELPLGADAGLDAPAAPADDSVPAWQALCKYLNQQLSDGSSHASAFGLLFDIDVVVRDMAATIPISSFSPEMLVLRLGKLAVSSSNKLVNYSGAPAFTVAHSPTIAMPKLSQPIMNRTASFSHTSRQSFSAYRPSYMRNSTLSRNPSFSRMPTADDDEFQDMEEYNSSTPSLVARNSVAFASPGTFFSLMASRGGELASSPVFQTGLASNTAPVDVDLPEDVMWTMSARPSLGPAATTLHYHTLQPTFTVQLNAATISTFAFTDNDGVREQSPAPREGPGVRLRMMPLMFIDGAHITATNSAYVPVVDVAALAGAKYALTHTALAFHPQVPARDWSVGIDCAHSNIIVAQPHIAACLSLLAQGQFLQGNLAEKCPRQFPRFYVPLPSDFANENDLSYLAFYLPKHKHAIEQGARSLREARKSIERKENALKHRERERKLAAAKSKKRASMQGPAPADMSTPFEVDEEAHRLAERRQLHEMMVDVLAEAAAMSESVAIDANLAVGVDAHGLFVPIAASAAVEVIRRHAKGVAVPAAPGAAATGDMWEGMSVLSRSLSMSVSKRSESQLHGGGWGLPWTPAADTATDSGEAKAALSVDVRLRVPHVCLLMCTDITKATSPALALSTDFSLLSVMENNGELGLALAVKEMMMVSGDMPTTDLEALYTSLSNTLVDAAILQPCDTRVAVSLTPASALEKPLNAASSLIPVHPRFRYLPVCDDDIFVPNAAAYQTMSTITTRAAGPAAPSAPIYTADTAAGTVVAAVDNDGKLSSATVLERQLGGPAIVVDCRVSEMRMKVSYSDYERLMTCFAALSMPPSQDASSAPALGPTAPIPDVHAHTHDTVHPSGAVPAAPAARVEATSEFLPYSLGDMRVTVAVDPITISLLNDSAGFTVPFLLVGCDTTKLTLNALAHTRTITLHTGANIQYYNGSVASWEPLLEHAELQALVGQDALRGMRVLLESKGPINLNMTRSMMDGVNQSLSMLATAQKAMQKRNAAKLLELSGEAAAAAAELEAASEASDAAEAMVLRHGNSFSVLQQELVRGADAYVDGADRALEPTHSSSGAGNSPQLAQNKGAFAFVRLANHTEYPLYYTFGLIPQTPELAQLSAEHTDAAQCVALTDQILQRNTRDIFASRPSIVHLCRAARILVSQQLQVFNGGYLPCTPLAIAAFHACYKVIKARDTKPDPFATTATPVPNRQRMLWSLLVHAARLRALRHLAKGRTGLLGSRQETPLYPDAGARSTRTLAGLTAEKASGAGGVTAARTDEQSRAAKRRLISLQLGAANPLCNIPIDSVGSYSFRVHDRLVNVEIAVANGIKVISVHSNRAIVNTLDVPLQVHNDIVMPGETYYLPLAKADEPVAVRPVTTVAAVAANNSYTMGAALQSLLQTGPDAEVAVRSAYAFSDAVTFPGLTNGRVLTCAPTTAQGQHFSMVVQRWRCRSVTYVSLAPPVAVTNLTTEPCHLKLLAGVVPKKGKVAIDDTHATTTIAVSIVPSHCLRAHTGILHAPVSTAPAPPAQTAPSLALSLTLPRLGLSSDPVILPTANDAVMRIPLRNDTGATLTILARVSYAPTLQRSTTTSLQQTPSLHTLSSAFTAGVDSQLSAPFKSSLLNGSTPLAYVGSRLAPSALYAAVSIALYAPLWIVDTSYLGLVAASSRISKPSLLQLPQQLHARASTVDPEDGITQTRTAALMTRSAEVSGEASKELLAAASGVPTPLSDALYSRAVMFTLDADQREVQVRRAGPEQPGTKPPPKSDGSGIMWHSDWSSPFDPSNIGATIQLSMRDSATDQQWVISGVVRSAPAPFIHTKVLVLSAGMMIVNRLPMPVALRQYSLAHVGSASDDTAAGVKWVQPHGIAQWHWEQRRERHLASFKMVTSTDPVAKVGHRQLRRNERVGNELYDVVGTHAAHAEGDAEKSPESRAIADVTVSPEAWNTQMTMNGAIVSATRKPISAANSAVVPGLLSLSVPEGDGNVVQTVAGQQWTQGTWEWSGYLDLSKVGDTTMLLRNSVTHKCFMVSARVVMTSPDFAGAAGNTFTVVLEPQDLSFARYRVENRTRIDTVLFSQVGCDAWMTVSPMETSLYALDQPTAQAKLQVQVVNGSQTAYGQYELGKLGYLGCLTLRTHTKARKTMDSAQDDATSTQFSTKLAYGEDGETHKVHVTVRGEGPTHVIIFSNTKDMVDDVGSLLAADVDSLVAEDERKHAVGLNTYNIGRSIAEEASTQGVRVGGVTVLASDVLDEMGAVSKDIMDAARVNKDVGFTTYKTLFSHLDTRVRGEEVGVRLENLLVDWPLLKRLFPYLTPTPKHTRTRLTATAADIVDALIARKKLLDTLPGKYARTVAQALRVLDLRKTEAKNVLSPKTAIAAPVVSMPFTSMTAPPQEVTVASSVRESVHTSVSAFAGNAEYLLVRVVSARWLSAGKRNGLSDCYAVVSVNGETYRSPVATNTINPHWNMAVAVRMPPAIATDSTALDNLVVKVSVWHKNSLLSDDYLGGIIVGNMRATINKGASATVAALETPEETAEVGVADKLLTLMVGADTDADGVTGEDMAADPAPAVKDTVNAEEAAGMEVSPSGTTSSAELSRSNGWAPLYGMRQNKRARGEILLEFAWVRSEAEKQERLLGLMLEDLERDVVAVKQLNSQYAEDFLGVDVGVVDIDTLQLMPMHKLPAHDVPITALADPTAAVVGCCGKEDKEAKRKRKERERQAKLRGKVDVKKGEQPWEVVQSALGPVEVPRGTNYGYLSVPPTQLQPTLLKLCEAWVRKREERERRLQMIDVRVAVQDVAISAQRITEVLVAHPDWLGREVLAVLECNGHVVALPVGTVKLKSSLQARPRGSLALKLLHAMGPDADVPLPAVDEREYTFTRNAGDVEALFSVPAWVLAQTNAAVNVKIVVVAARAHTMSCSGEQLRIPRQASLLVDEFPVPLRSMPFHGPDGELLQLGENSVVLGPHWFSTAAPVVDTSTLARAIGDNVLLQALEADAYAALHGMTAHMFSQYSHVEDFLSVSMPSTLTPGTHTGEAQGSSVSVEADKVIYVDKAGVRTEFPKLPRTPARISLVCTLSPSSDLEDRIGMDVVARFAHFGISLVDTFAGRPEEVLYVSALGTEVSLSESHTQRSIELMVQSFQIDQQCRTDVIAKDEDSIVVGPALESLNSGKPLVHMAAVQCKTNADYPVLVFNHFTFLMQAIEIQVEEGLLWRLLALATDLIPPSSAQDDASVLSALAVDKRILFAAEEKYASQQAFYFQALHIQPLLMFFTFHANAAARDSGAGVTINPITLALNAVTGILGNIDAAPLAFNALVVRDAYGDMATLLQPVVQFYVGQGITQVYKIIGSIEVLGNPVSLVSGVGSGVKDFFYEPAQGLVKSPKQFGVGLAKGSAALVKSVTSGVFGAAAKITTSVGSGITVLTMDKDFAARRRARNRRKVKHALDGLGRGAGALTHGIFSGLTGLVLDPLRGAKHGGVGGFAKGMVKGITGVFTKTASGAVDLVGLTLQGVGNTFTGVGDAVERRRVRRTRFISPVGAMREYDPTWALADSALALIHTEAGSQRGVSGAIQGVRNALELTSGNEANSLSSEIDLIMSRLQQLSKSAAATADVDIGMGAGSGSRMSSPATLLRELQDVLPYVREKDHSKALDAIAQRMHLAAREEAFHETLINCFTLNKARTNAPLLPKKSRPKQPGRKQRRLPEYLVMISDQRVVFVEQQEAAAALAAGGQLGDNKVALNARIEDIVDIVPEYTREGDNGAAVLVTVMMKSKWKHGVPETHTVSVPTASPMEAKLTAIRLWCTLGGAAVVAASCVSAASPTVTSITSAVRRDLSIAPLTRYTTFAATPAVARDWALMMGYSRSVLSPRSPTHTDQPAGSADAETVTVACTRLHITPPENAAAVTVLRRGAADAVYPTGTLRSSPWTCVLRRPEYQQSIWRALLEQADDKNVHVVSVVYQRGRRMYSKSFVDTQSIVLM